MTHNETKTVDYTTDLIGSILYVVETDGTRHLDVVVKQDGSLVTFDRELVAVDLATAAHTESRS